jgi:hypothetical protein
MAVERGECLDSKLLVGDAFYGRTTLFIYTRIVNKFPDLHMSAHGISQLSTEWKTSQTAEAQRKDISRKGIFQRS